VMPLQDAAGRAASREMAADAAYAARLAALAPGIREARIRGLAGQPAGASRPGWKKHARR
jgi:hypothetical protein